MISSRQWASRSDSRWRFVGGGSSSSDEETEYLPRSSLSEDDEKSNETDFLALEERTRIAPRGCRDDFGGSGDVLMVPMRPPTTEFLPNCWTAASLRCTFFTADLTKDSHSSHRRKGSLKTLMEVRWTGSGSAILKAFCILSTRFVQVFKLYARNLSTSSSKALRRVSAGRERIFALTSFHCRATESRCLSTGWRNRERVEGGGLESRWRLLGWLFVLLRSRRSNQFSRGKGQVLNCRGRILWVRLPGTGHRHSRYVCTYGK